jgi:uncharacterized protein (DUF1330 family)
MADKRPAYVIAEVEITDPAVFQDYVAKAVPTRVGTGAPFFARAKAKAKEGTAPVGDIVMLRFNSLKVAQHWYHGAAYGNAIPCASARPTRGFSSSRVKRASVKQEENSALREAG